MNAKLWLGCGRHSGGKASPLPSSAGVPTGQLQVALHASGGRKGGVRNNEARAGTDRAVGSTSRERVPEQGAVERKLNEGEEVGGGRQSIEMD